MYVVNIFDKTNYLNTLLFADDQAIIQHSEDKLQKSVYTRVGTLIVATIYLQLIQNRYMFRSFTVLQ